MTWHLILRHSSKNFFGEGSDSFDPHSIDWPSVAYGPYLHYDSVMAGESRN